MSASADISGLLRGLQQHRDRARAAVRRGVTEVAAQTIGDSQQLAPVKTGALKASGMLGELVENGDLIVQEMGHNTDYAAAVHERKANHEQGQDKFLEAAIKQNQPKLSPHVAAKVKAATGG